MEGKLGQRKRSRGIGVLVLEARRGVSRRGRIWVWGQRLKRVGEKGDDLILEGYSVRNFLKSYSLHRVL